MRPATSTEESIDMTWLTRAAVNRRSVTILLAAGLFICGVIAWGSLKQELLPDVSFPVATVIAPFPGAAADDVADQVVGTDRARRPSRLRASTRCNSTSANSIGFVIGPVRVRHRCRRGDRRDGGGDRRR